MGIRYLKFLSALNKKFTNCSWIIYFRHQLAGYLSIMIYVEKKRNYFNYNPCLILDGRMEAIHEKVIVWDSETFILKLSYQLLLNWGFLPSSLSAITSFGLVYNVQYYTHLHWYIHQIKMDRYQVAEILYYTFVFVFLEISI